MINIRLAGGLGNQLFQLAAGLEIQKWTSLSISINYNALSKYSTKREPSVLAFITLSEKIKLFNKLLIETKLLEKRVGKLSINGVFPLLVNINTNQFLKSGIKCFFVDGYFQNISKICNGLIEMKLLIESKANNDKIIESIFKNIVLNSDQDEIVAIHIRRGDYINEQFKSIYPTLDENYYKNAINILGVEIKKIVLFSDDSDISFDFFDDYEIIRISSFKMVEVQELMLMSMFKNIVIANSTFSFWGAICQNNLEKRKIAPTLWSNIKKENDKWQNNLRNEMFITID